MPDGHAHEGGQLAADKRIKLFELALSSAGAEHSAAFSLLYKQRKGLIGQIAGSKDAAVLAFAKDLIKRLPDVRVSEGS